MLPSRLANSMCANAWHVGLQVRAHKCVRSKNKGCVYEVVWGCGCVHLMYEKREQWLCVYEHCVGLWVHGFDE